MRSRDVRFLVDCQYHDAIHDRICSTRGEQSCHIVIQINNTTLVPFAFSGLYRSLQAWHFVVVHANLHLRICALKHVRSAHLPRPESSECGSHCMGFNKYNGYRLVWYLHHLDRLHKNTTLITSLTLNMYHKLSAGEGQTYVDESGNVKPLNMADPHYCHPPYTNDYKYSNSDQYLNIGWHQHFKSNWTLTFTSLLPQTQTDLHLNLDLILSFHAL